MIITKQIKKILLFIFILNFPFYVFAQDSGNFIDERDNNTYKWVRIGGQIWMSENLAYLPSISPVSMPLNEAEINPKYFVYGYNGNSIRKAKKLGNYNSYGVLYNWLAAKTSCPKGWHLPTDEEWKKLEEHLGMPVNQLDDHFYRAGGDIGYKLKSKKGWGESGNGIDLFEFSILPGGFRHDGDHNDDKNNGAYSYLGDEAFFWTATKYNNKASFRRHFNLSNRGIDRFPGSRSSGYCVRCVKD